MKWKTNAISKIARKLKKDDIDYRVERLPNYESQSSLLVKMYLSRGFGKNAKDV